MRLFSIFNENNIFFNLGVSSRENILEKMIKELLDDVSPERIKQIVQKLKECEDSPWFAPDDDVVVSHARVDDIEDYCVALAIFKEPVYWSDENGRKKEVNIVFLILTSTFQNMKMIQTLDAIARFCELRHNVEALSNVKGANRALKVIEESDIDVRAKLTAEYLMNTEFKKISPELTLREAAVIISKISEDAVPVVNEKNELLGEFTSEAILKIGVPNYMNMLSNVDFLNNFEPFENFYKKEKYIKVKELISERILTTPPDASVIEVAYKIISAGLRRIYVIDNKKLVGVIYRRDIVSKILLA